MRRFFILFLRKRFTILIPNSETRQFTAMKSKITKSIRLLGSGHNHILKINFLTVSKKLLLLLCFAPLLLASSCNRDDDDDQIVCTQEFVYGLNVVVLNSATGNPLVEGVTVEATDGSYNETLQVIPGLEYSFAGAGERAGVYTVTITKSGYQTYISSPIVVNRDFCHVIPKSLTVNLQSN